MSKNILTKALVVLIVVTLSAALLTGCTPFSKTATVNLSGTITALDRTYNIYVDDVFKGTVNGTSSLEITGLSIGSHIFKATSVDYFGEKSAIVTGLMSITVTIPVALLVL